MLFKNSQDQAKQNVTQICLQSGMSMPHAIRCEVQRYLKNDQWQKAWQLLYTSATTGEMAVSPQTQQLLVTTGYLMTDK